jgi:hypothetical protein
VVTLLLIIPSFSGTPGGETIDSRRLANRFLFLFIRWKQLKGEGQLPLVSSSD